MRQGSGGSGGTAAATAAGACRARSSLFAGGSRSVPSQPRCAAVPSVRNPSSNPKARLRPSIDPRTPGVDRAGCWDGQNHSTVRVARELAGVQSLRRSPGRISFFGFRWGGWGLGHVKATRGLMSHHMCDSAGGKRGFRWYGKKTRRHHQPSRY